MPLKVSDGIGAWIKDFQKSDAPQFKGKNKDERRDMAVAAYLTAKRGPLKDEDVRQEAMTAKQKADMDRAMAAFKKRGGRVKKLPPGRAQGAHGKDDPAAGMRGMLDRGDTKKFKTRKKIRSMGEGVMEAVDPKMRKVKQLATLGLVGKSDVNKLMMAMKSMDAGKEVKPQHRKIIFDAFGDLIDLVTGDTQVFQKAKKKVKEQYDYGTDDSVKHMKKVTPGQKTDKDNPVDEAVNYKFVAIDRVGKVIGFASDFRDAKDMAKRGHTMDSPSKGRGIVGRNKAKVVKLHKPLSPKKGDMMVGREFDIRPGKGDKTVFSIGLDEKKLMKGIEVDDDTLRMFKANPNLVRKNSPVFRRLDPKTQKAVKKHLGIR